MMRVQQITKAGKRLRKSLPKTMDVIQTRVEKIGSGVVSGLSALRSSAAVAKAGKAVRRGSQETVKWVRKNPSKALPLAGLGGALLWLLFRPRPKASPKLLRNTMGFLGPQVRKGLGSSLGRFLSWALTPRKPHVFRAISIKW